MVTRPEPFAKKVGAEDLRSRLTAATDRGAAGRRGPPGAHHPAGRATRRGPHRRRVRTGAATRRKRPFGVEGRSPRQPQCVHIGSAGSSQPTCEEPACSVPLIVVRSPCSLQRPDRFRRSPGPFVFTVLLDAVPRSTSVRLMSVRALAPASSPLCVRCGRIEETGFGFGRGQGAAVPVSSGSAGAAMGGC